MCEEAFWLHVSVDLLRYSFSYPTFLISIADAYITMWLVSPSDDEYISSWDFWLYSKYAIITKNNNCILVPNGMVLNHRWALLHNIFNYHDQMPKLRSDSSSVARPKWLRRWFTNNCFPDSRVYLSCITSCRMDTPKRSWKLYQTREILGLLWQSFRLDLIPVTHRSIIYWMVSLSVSVSAIALLLYLFCRT